MVLVRVTPEEVHTAASLFDASSRESEDLVGRLQGRINWLEGEWDGVMQQRFYGDFQQWSGEMRAFVELLTNIGQQLHTIADGFAAADQRLAGGQQDLPIWGGSPPVGPLGPPVGLPVGPQSNSGSPNPWSSLVSAGGGLTTAGMLLLQQKGWSGFVQALRGLRNPAITANNLVGDVGEVQDVLGELKGSDLYSSIKGFDTDAAANTFMGAGTLLDFLSSGDYSWHGAAVSVLSTGVTIGVEAVTSAALTAALGASCPPLGVILLADTGVEIAGGGAEWALNAMGQHQAAQDLDAVLKFVDINQHISDLSHTVAERAVDVGQTIFQSATEHGLLQDAAELSPAGPLLSLVDPSMFPPKSPVDMFGDVTATAQDLGGQGWKAAQPLGAAAESLAGQGVQAVQTIDSIQSDVATQSAQAVVTAGSTIGSAIASGGQRLLGMLGI